MSNTRKVKTDESGNPLKITINNSTTNILAKENSEVITIDDSFEEVKDDSIFKKPSDQVDMDTTVVNFDNTLPPGVAPEGFVILDEDLNTSRIDENENNEQNEPEPLFEVKFRDNSAVRKYRHKIEDFCRKIISGKKSTKFSVGELILNVYDFELEKKSKKKTSSTSNEVSKENQLNDSLFTVDTLPKIQDILDIPVYGKKFNKALEVSKKENVKDSDLKDDCAPKLTCFNCLGNHSLRDCDQPRNFNVINKNRKDFMSRKGSSSSRYHLEDDQRFGHFQPGTISTDLRKALGLKDNEIPRHIYRMRELGYPPGWLEEARQQHSGLSLFNSDGLAEAGCSDEEGEIIAPGDKDKFDINKLIDFPGFNVEAPAGTRDINKAYWGSTQQQNHSKELMLSQLSKKKAKEGYKRRKLPNPAQLKVSQNVNSGEMEIDDVEDTALECIPIKDLFIPPLPKESLDNPPPPPPPPNEFDDSDEPSQDTQSPASEGEIIELSPINSPSLRDLETKKNQLLAALSETSFSSNLDISSKSDASEDTNTIKENNDFVTPQSNRTQSFIEVKEKSSMSVSVGTPVIKSISPFNKLPCPEKFSKNICDVINFENLPDSTGKYDQMIGVLQKVRSTLAELNKD